MSTQIQRRRGTTAEHSTFTGALAETTIDTDKDTVVVHDGTTVGGHPLMRENGSNSALALGSAGTPSLKFTGDPNTGIYSPGADQVAISTNGTGRLFVDANGVVDIYNSTPKLGFSSVGSFYNWIECGGVAGNNYMRFATANTERLRITSDGNVGVGTSSPVSVTGFGTLFTVANNAGGGIVLQDANTTVGYRNKYIASVDGEIHFGKCADDGTSPTTQVLLDHNGRLGVGTTSPPALCSIAGPGVAGNVGRLLQVYAASASGAGSGSEIWLGWNPSTLSTGGGVTIGGVYNGSGTDILFSTPANTSSAPTEKVRIDSSGRVGIGTSSPQAVLESKTANVQPGDAAYAKKSVVANIPYSTSNVTSSALAVYDGTVHAADIGYSYDGTGYYLTLGTNDDTVGSPTERLRIDRQGRVGIGTSTPQGLCDVAGSNGRLVLANGNTSGGMKITAANSAYNADGYLAFEGYSSEYGRFDSSGRLLVGTSTSRSFNSHEGALQIDGDTYSESTVAIVSNSNTSNGAYLFFVKQRSGSAGGNTVVQNNDIIGEIRFNSGDGTDCESFSGQIQCLVDGTPGSNDVPGRLVFSTTADGASSPTERMRIHSTGNTSLSGGISLGGLGDPGSYIVFNGAVIGSGAGTYALKWNNTNGRVTYDTSSRLIKEGIVDCPYGIDEIRRLQPRKYFRTDDQREEIGFVADEVASVMPEFVPVGPKSVITRNDEDTEEIALGVNYDKLTAVLTKALQEAITKIESLEARLTAAGI